MLCRREWSARVVDTAQHPANGSSYGRQQGQP